MLLKIAITSLLTTAVLASSDKVSWVATLGDGPMDDSNPKGQPVGGYVSKHAHCGECHSVDRAEYHHFTGLYFAPDDGGLGINFYSKDDCKDWIGWFKGNPGTAHDKFSENDLKKYHPTKSLRVCWWKKPE
ncbi:hypothetical protein BV22DRAFT_1034695 [Leucogyrophana mollusca]|uniref:Uncharacterized protein n=1 Tax=Leucogyrophana mollusca TaxID=85980 RepID=A0ACB8BHP3_9AGAM|nr:hypothetical protein BV22DRAFT_1034695 [Leucogyrophana mollusca]